MVGGAYVVAACSGGAAGGAPWAEAMPMGPPQCAQNAAPAALSWPQREQNMVSSFLCLGLQQLAVRGEQQRDEGERPRGADHRPEDGAAPAVLLRVAAQVAGGEQAEEQGEGRRNDEEGEEARVAGRDGPPGPTDGQQHPHG